MRSLLLALLLAVPFTGCRMENRPDGGNSDQSNADDAAQDAYEATTGSQGATPLAMPEDTLAVQEALGDAPAAAKPPVNVPEPLPPSSPPPPPPPPPVPTEQ